MSRLLITHEEIAEPSRHYSAAVLLRLPLCAHSTLRFTRAALRCASLPIAWIVAFVALAVRCGAVLSHRS